MLARNGVMIQALENRIVLMPGACDGFGSVKEGIHGLGPDQRDSNWSYQTGKVPEDHRLRAGTHSLRPHEGNVFFDKSREFHSTPPRSKAATSRNPARSTLA